MDRLVGQSNESHVIVDGVSHKALLDSGSMVTTMSESVFRSLPSRPTLLHLDTLGLTLAIADGSQMKYSGYVETTVSIPSVSDFTLDVPILVIPDNQFNCTCPVIVGTNVLRRCKDAIDPPSSTIDEAWKSAINSLECRSYPVRCLGRKPVTLGPFQTKTIHGIARHLPSDVTCAVTETPDNTNISFTVCPRLMQLDSNASSSRIPVKICNITAKTLIIKPKALLCEFTKARAVDNLLPDEKCTSVKNTPKVSLDTSKLSQEQVEKFHQVLGKWQHIFCSDTKDIGKTNLVKHKIVLDDPTPFKEPYRWIPPAMFEEVRQHVKEMLQAGVIRESDSPYSSNIVLIRKSNGALRFCVDWRKLNNRTWKDAYMLPRFDDTIDVLSSAKFFSKIDLHSAYWQVEVEEEDKPKTAFSVGPLGFYEWNRMGFGLTNAPATFQRLMEKCMGDMHLKECLVFLDDILIFSTTFEEHLQRLEAVFQRLDQHHLRLKPSKCEFFQSTVKYLGHIISEKGIQPDPEKIAAVMTWPTPKNVKELRQFLGFTGYYRRFVKNYAQIVQPLNALLEGHLSAKQAKSCKSKKRKRAALWIWSQDQQIAFDNIKVKLTSPPVLAYANYSLPFELHVDASSQGLGAVLYQTQNEQKKVIAYASRGLRQAERKYPAHKLEFLALKWSVTDKFRDYLYGSSFKVVTDNNPLTYVLTTAKVDATGHRWLAELSNFNFTIEYRSGKLNSDADGMSQRYVFNEELKAVFQAAVMSTPLMDCVSDTVAPHVASVEAPCQEISSIYWVVEQSKDPDILQVFLSSVPVFAPGEEVSSPNQLLFNPFSESGTDLLSPTKSFAEPLLWMDSQCNSWFCPKPTTKQL